MHSTEPLQTPLRACCKLQARNQNANMCKISPQYSDPRALHNTAVFGSTTRPAVFPAR